MLLAAIEVPDDLRVVHVDLAIPVLSLARIDSFARHHGLTHSALFVEAVNRWAMQESLHRERRGGISDGPTLFDFGNPLELRVEPITAAADPHNAAAAHVRDTEEGDTQRKVADITAELVRLLEERPEPQPIDEAAGEVPNRPIRQTE